MKHIDPGGVPRFRSSMKIELSWLDGSIYFVATYTIQNTTWIIEFVIQCGRSLSPTGEVHAMPCQCNQINANQTKLSPRIINCDIDVYEPLKLSETMPSTREARGYRHEHASHKTLIVVKMFGGCASGNA